MWPLRAQVATDQAEGRNALPYLHVRQPGRQYQLWQGVVHSTQRQMWGKATFLRAKAELYELLLDAVLQQTQCPAVSANADPQDAGPRPSGECADGIDMQVERASHYPAKFRLHRGQLGL